MKSEKELEKLKKRVAELNKELEELSEEEYQMVTGGTYAYGSSIHSGRLKPSEECSFLDTDMSDFCPRL